jgi:hypothetical protein
LWQQVGVEPERIAEMAIMEEMEADLQEQMVGNVALKLLM